MQKNHKKPICLIFTLIIQFSLLSMQSNKDSITVSSSLLFKINGFTLDIYANTVNNLNHNTQTSIKKKMQLCVLPLVHVITDTKEDVTLMIETEENNHTLFICADCVTQDTSTNKDNYNLFSLLFIERVLRSKTNDSQFASFIYENDVKLKLINESHIPETCLQFDGKEIPRAGAFVNHDNNFILLAQHTKHKTYTIYTLSWGNTLKSLLFLIAYNKAKENQNKIDAMYQLNALHNSNTLKELIKNNDPVGLRFQQLHGTC